MLVLKYRADPTKTGDGDDEAGVALVVVVVVMLVGFVIAATVAASVMFTIGANQVNKSRTQAFIAAESGRDQLRSQIANANAAGNCTSATLSATLSSPQVTATAKTTANDTVSGFSDPSLASACPNPSTHRIVIESTGTGPDGSTSKILSVYNWQVVSQNSPGGTMGGYTGVFHGVGGGSSGSYTGDLVVRSGIFTCSSTNSVRGDLWVLGGADGSAAASVTLSGGCTITGSIYTFGTVTTSGGNATNPIVVGKSVVARGGVSMDSNGVTIGGQCVPADGASCGQIASGGAVNLTNTGGIGTVVGTVTGSTNPSISSNWKRPDLTTAVVGAIGPAPTFTPPLNSSQNGGVVNGTVYGMTTWVELGAGTTWGSSSTRVTCPADASSALSSATTPLILDYSGAGCSATSGQTTEITLSGGNVPHDAVFLVAPGKTMKVSIAGSVTNPSGPSKQLFFVHEDSNTGNSAPDCGRPTGDDFNVGSTVSIAPHIMLYTACGINGTWNGDLTGQIYVGGSMTYSGNFTCQPMAWAPTPSPLPTMDCRILGAGGAAGGTTYTQTLGGIVSQIEQ